MNSTIRNLVVGGLASGVAAALCLAAPADAAVISGGDLTITAGADGIDTSACTLTAAPSDVTGTFTDGHTVTKTMPAFTQTATNTGDPTDKVTFRGSASQTVRSTVSGGRLTSLSLAGRANASFSQSLGAVSACADTTSSDGMTVNTSATAQAAFHQPGAAWVHLQASVAGTGVKGAQVVIAPSGSLTASNLNFTYELSYRNIKRDEWFYIVPGDYTVQALVGVSTSQSPAVTSSSATTSFKLTFVRPGTAKAPASGKAKPVVSLPGKLNCTTGKATVNLTKKAKGTTSVALYVNGKKKTTIRHPHRARSVTLSGVPTTTDVTLKAVVKTGRKSQSVSRSYHSC